METEMDGCRYWIEGQSWCRECNDSAEEEKVEMVRTREKDSREGEKIRKLFPPWQTLILCYQVGSANRWRLKEKPWKFCRQLTLNYNSNIHYTSKNEHTIDVCIFSSNILFYLYGTYHNVVTSVSTFYWSWSWTCRLCLILEYAHAIIPDFVLVFANLWDL